MTPDNFTYWLQGHVELNPEQKAPTEAQWAMIKEHLELAFRKVTNPLTSLPAPWAVTTPFVHPDIKSPLDLNNLTITC